MIKHNLVLSVALVFFSLCIACGSPEKTGESGDGPKAGPSAMAIHKGFAVHGPEVRSFRPCGAEEPLWAIDSSGLMWELYGRLALQNYPYMELFAIVEGRLGPPPQEGFGADYAGALEVQRILYMAREGFRCDLDLSVFRFRAYGNEPFWSVVISDGGILLRMPGCEDRTWQDFEEQPVDHGLLYKAAGTDGAIEILIFEEPCQDSMSGACFAYSANMTLDSVGFKGCALRGTGSLIQDHNEPVAKCRPSGVFYSQS